MISAVQKSSDQAAVLLLSDCQQSSWPDMQRSAWKQLQKSGCLGKVNKNVREKEKHLVLPLPPSFVLIEYGWLKGHEV